MLCPLRLEIEAMPDQLSDAIDMEFVKSHMKIDVGDDDVLLSAYLQAAILWAEGATHRTIYSRSHTWVLRDFEYCYPHWIRLPRGRTTSIESVSYSFNGSLTTLHGDSSSSSPADLDYQEDLRGNDGGILMPNRGSCWPSVDYDVPAPVAIEFTAGWLPQEIPADLWYAIAFYMLDLNELRGTTDYDASLLTNRGAHLAAREALVSPYRLTRWY